MTDRTGEGIRPPPRDPFAVEQQGGMETEHATINVLSFCRDAMYHDRLGLRATQPQRARH